MLKSIVAICVGASLGALLRWWLSTRFNGFFPTIPPGTLIANLIGGYIIGLGIGFFAAFPSLSPEWRLLVITGFCGGLTNVLDVFSRARGPDARYLSCWIRLAQRVYLVTSQLLDSAIPRAQIDRRSSEQDGRTDRQAPVH